MKSLRLWSVIVHANSSTYVVAFSNYELIFVGISGYSFICYFYVLFHFVFAFNG